MKSNQSKPVDKSTPPPAVRRTLNNNQIETHRVTPPILRSLIGFIVIVAIIVGLVFGARAIYHATHKNKTQTGQTTVQRPGSNNKSTSSAGKSSSSSAAAKNVPNTGPGNVAAVFITASLAAAASHYIVSLRRADTKAD